MDIFKLSIADNGTDRKNQVLDYIDIWNGHEGLKELKDIATTEDMNRFIGDFVTSSVYVSDTINGIIIFDNDMGNLIDGIISTAAGFTKLTNTMASNYFDLAVELDNLYHYIDPYNDSNTVVGCLDLIKNHPEYVINGLIEELKERME